MPVTYKDRRLDGFDIEHQLPRRKEWAWWPDNISGSYMIVQKYPSPSPLITAVAEAADCFCKPQFLHLFKGGWLALPGTAV